MDYLRILVVCMALMRRVRSSDISDPGGLCKNCPGRPTLFLVRNTWQIHITRPASPSVCRNLTAACMRFWKFTHSMFSHCLFLSTQHHDRIIATYTNMYSTNKFDFGRSEGIPLAAQLRALDSGQQQLSREPLVRRGI